MASQQITLGVGQRAESAVVATAGSASANVILQFDNSEPLGEIINALDLVKQVLQDTVAQDWPRT